MLQLDVSSAPGHRMKDVTCGFKTRRSRCCGDPSRGVCCDQGPVSVICWELATVVSPKAAGAKVRSCQSSRRQGFEPPWEHCMFVHVVDHTLPDGNAPSAERPSSPRRAS